MDYLFVLLLALLLMWLGIRQFKINRKRITEGVIVKAKVTSIIEYPRQRGGPYFRPVVQFVTHKGDIINAELENSGKPQHTIGEYIEVLYDPNNPNEVTTTAWFANYVAPITFMAAGVVSLLIFISKVLH